MQQMELDAPLMTVARTRGERAAARCLEKAQRVADFNVDGAMKFVHSYLVRHGQQPGEILVNEAKAHGFRGHDDRCFGSVFSTLARRKQIVCVGYCERVKGNHCSGGRLWAAVL